MCLSFPFLSHYKNAKYRPKPPIPKTKDIRGNLRSKRWNWTPSYSASLSFRLPVTFDTMIPTITPTNTPEIKPHNFFAPVVLEWRLQESQRKSHSMSRTVPQYETPKYVVQGCYHWKYKTTIFDWSSDIPNPFSVLHPVLDSRRYRKSNTVGTVFHLIT